MTKKRKNRLPHFGVCTRLRPSKIHKGGVGVFAIISIKKGTAIFPDDTAPMIIVRSIQLKNLRKPIKKLYRDFPVIQDNGRALLCPKSFNQLTIAWYLNHSKKEANVVCNRNYNFFAKRNISAGEELAVDYTTYSERPR